MNLNYLLYLSLAFSVVGIAALSIAISLIDKAFTQEVEQLRDISARQSRVLAEHEGKFETLEINTDKEPIKSPTDIEKADALYNEGMDNIFGYSVTTGIKVEKNG